MLKYIFVEKLPIERKIIIMDEQIQEQELSEEQLSELLQIRRDKLNDLREAGKDPFTITKYEVSSYSQTIKENFVDPAEGEESTFTVSMAGRIMSKRGMGKASFADLQDKEGKIQLYIRKDMVGEDAYADFKKWDIGDIIGVEGIVFRTHMGEISVKATSINFSFYNIFRVNLFFYSIIKLF